jgi:hypothetical protein
MTPEDVEEDLWREIDDNERSLRVVGPNRFEVAWVVDHDDVRGLRAKRAIVRVKSEIEGMNRRVEPHLKYDITFRAVRGCCEGSGRS